MDDHRGSITVTALIGTGAATLGLAIFGLAGVGSDLRAADAARTSTPVISTQDLSDSLRQERTSPKWDGHSDCTPVSDRDADAGRSGATSSTPTPRVTRTPQPAPTPSADTAKAQEL